MDAIAELPAGDQPLDRAAADALEPVGFRILVGAAGCSYAEGVEREEARCHFPLAHVTLR